MKLFQDFRLTAGGYKSSFHCEASVFRRKAVVGSRKRALAAGALIALRAVALAAPWTAARRVCSTTDPRTSTLVVDRHGVRAVRSACRDGTRSVELTADNLPPMLVAATIAAEDRRFWSHPGVDPIAILRAVKTNLAERTIVEGGSTISQQVSEAAV